MLVSKHSPPSSADVNIQWEQLSCHLCYCNCCEHSPPLQGKEWLEVCKPWRWRRLRSYHGKNKLEEISH
jgi:hypothetical protein